MKELIGLIVVVAAILLMVVTAIVRGKKIFD